MPFEAPPALLDAARRPEIREVADALLDAGDYVRGLRERRSRGETVDRADVESAVSFIAEFDAVIQALEAEARTRPLLNPSTGTLAGTAQPLGAGHEFLTIGEQVVASETWQNAARGHRFAATQFEIETRGSLMHQREIRDTIISGATDTGVVTAGMWRPVGTPLPPPQLQQRRLFVRDLVSVQGTGLSSVPYIRELNAATNETGAAAVAENAAKTEVTMAWEQDDAPIRKIAAWIPVTTEILEDAPTLRGYIDTRLPYMLSVREELQLLSGTGTAPQIKGILNFSGLQTQAAVNADPFQTIAAAIGKIELVDGEADGIAMHPTKFWTVLATRQANHFDGGYGAAGAMAAPFGGPTREIWGLPVVRTRSLTATQCVVGSWRMGATIFDRASTSITVGNQHSDYFTNNKVAVLAEQRLGFAVHRADYFVLATV